MNKYIPPSIWDRRKSWLWDFFGYFFSTLLLGGLIGTFRALPLIWFIFSVFVGFSFTNDWPEKTTSEKMAAKERAEKEGFGVVQWGCVIFAPLYALYIYLRYST